jgi:hypothetical protein
VEQTLEGRRRVERQPRAVGVQVENPLLRRREAQPGAGAGGRAWTGGGEYVPIRKHNWGQRPKNKVAAAGASTGGERWRLLEVGGVQRCEPPQRGNRGCGRERAPKRGGCRSWPLTKASLNTAVGSRGQTPEGRQGSV